MLSRTRFRARAHAQAAEHERARALRLELPARIIGGHEKEALPHLCRALVDRMVRLNLARQVA